jgi:molybdopterin molybdotransferase
VFLPVSLNRGGDAPTTAQPRPTKGSGDFTSLIGTDGFVELPPGARVIPAGTLVPFYGW